MSFVRIVALMAYRKSMFFPVKTHIVLNFVEGLFCLIRRSVKSQSWRQTYLKQLDILDKSTNEFSSHFCKHNRKCLKTPGRVLRKYLYGDAQSRLQNVDHLYTCVLKKRKKKSRSLYLTCMTKPTHLYTIFTEMMTHYIIIFISKTAHRHTITEIRGH